MLLDCVIEVILGDIVLRRYIHRYLYVITHTHTNTHHYNKQRARSKGSNKNIVSNLHTTGLYLNNGERQRDYWSVRGRVFITGLSKHTDRELDL